MSAVADTHRAAGLVLAQITSLQLGSVVAKDLFSSAGPTGTASLRVAWTALVLCALVRPRLRGLSSRQLTTALALGLVVAAMNLAYFQVIARIPLGIGSSLELLGPLGLSLLLSRRPTDLLWAGLCASGVFLLAAPGGEQDLAGIAFGATAGLLRACYVLLNRRLGELFTEWRYGKTNAARSLALRWPIITRASSAQPGAYPSLSTTTVLPNTGNLVVVHVVLGVGAYATALSVWSDDLSCCGHDGADSGQAR